MPGNIPEDLDPKIKEWLDPELKLDPDCYMFLGDYKDRSVSILGKFWIRGSTALIAGAGSFYLNYLIRRPMMSGLPRHLAATLTGYMLGCWLQKKRNEILGEKDLMYFHYMTLHPEDFPPKEKVKYRDFLGEWIPIR